MREPSNSIGNLTRGVVQNSLFDQTVEFVWQSLIPWKNDPQRPHAEAEEDLNAQFHNFLQARANEVFPMVLFQMEQRQEGRRRVDLSVKPIHQVTIMGVPYNKYLPFLVIEGKRLPTPSKTREREYVTGDNDISGGIQRFKLGLHGREHTSAILLGYLQKGDAPQWHSRVNGWISELSESQPCDWSSDESLSELDHQKGCVRARTVSRHPRGADCRSLPIEILHLWIQFD